MDLEEYQSRLKRKIDFWEQNEREDYEKNLPEAAYRASMAKTAYEYALKLSQNIEL